MDKKQEKPVDDWKVPQSIIDHYAPFVNTKDKTKITKRVKTKFEIDERYDIIDSGKVII